MRGGGAGAGCAGVRAGGVCHRSDDRECDQRDQKQGRPPYPGSGDAEASYETVPAQTVDLAAEREKLVGEKVNASYDIENEKIIPSHAGVSFTLADLQSAYDAPPPIRSTVLPLR